MNRFSTARGNAPAPVTVTGSASFRSARAESRRAAARSARLPALPAVRRTDRAGDDRTAEGAGSLRTAFGSALFAMPVAAVAGFIFLLIAAGTVCAMPDPDSLITPLGLSVLGLTVLCGGFVCSRRAGCAPLLCGLLFGGLAVLVLFLGSLCFGDASRQALSLGLSSGARAGLYVALVAISCFGALIGRRR